MAGTGTITITGSLLGGNTGTKTFPSASIVNTSAIENTGTQALGIGDTTITLPAGTLGLYILPIGNTTVLKLKGAAGDTGIQISKTNPTVLAFDSTLPALIINAVAATTVWLIFV